MSKRPVPSVFFMAAFTALTVLRGDLAGLDRAVRGAALSVAPWTQAVGPALMALHYAFGTACAFAFSAAVTLWLVFMRRGFEAGLFGSGMALLVLANTAVKYAVASARPGQELFGVLQSDYSFPSGHAMFSLALAIFAVYLFRRGGKPKAAAVAGAILFPAAALVGISRILLDVHWLSDVAGGWLLSAWLAPMYIAVFERIFGKKDAKEETPS